MSHPLHPMFVHFPIASWSLSTIGDIASLQFGEQIGWPAGLLLIVGTVSALLAMFTGLLELGKINNNNKALKVANLHMSMVLLAWCFYASALFLRIQKDTLAIPGFTEIILSIIGFIFLCVAGWLGGQLVYKHKLGINEL